MQVGLQGNGFFTKSSSGSSVQQTTSESGGFLLNFRYNLTRWISADATYGRNRVTDRYFTPGFSTVQATAHQFTGGFVAELPVFPKVRPYLMAEGGAILFDPTGSQTMSVAGAQTQAAGTFVYGGGIDYSLFRYLALRAEYRGLVYDSPDFNIRALNANAVRPHCGTVCRYRASLLIRCRCIAGIRLEPLLFRVSVIRASQSQRRVR